LWDRLEDISLCWFIPEFPLPTSWGRGGKNYLITLDLRGVEKREEKEGRKNLSCEYALEDFAEALNGARGRIWVASERMKKAFESAKEETKRTPDGVHLGRKVQEILIEFSTVRPVLRCRVPVLDVRTDDVDLSFQVHLAEFSDGQREFVTSAWVRRRRVASLSFVSFPFFSRPTHAFSSFSC